MLISISGIGCLIFARWLYLAEQTAESIAVDINDSIYNQIYSLMYVPDHINKS